MSNNTNQIKFETNKIMGIDIVYFKTFATSLVAAFFFILTIIVLVIPKFGEIGEMNDSVAKLERDTKGVADKIKYLSSVDQNSLRDGEGVMLRAIPDSKDVYYLMSVVKQVAANYSYEVDAFSVSPGEVDEDTSKPSTAKLSVNKIPLGVNLIGPREKYLDLLTGFENSLPIMSLDQFTMQPEGSLASIRLTIGTYSSNRLNNGIKEPSLADVQLGDKEKKLIERLSSYTKIEIASSSAVLNDIDIGDTKIDPFNL